MPMLISTSALIGQSVKFFFSAKNFKQVMPYVGLSVLLVLVCYGVPGVLGYLAYSSGVWALWILVVLVALASVCILVYLGIWLKVGIFKALKNALDNKPMSIKANLKSCRHLILPFFSTQLLQTVLLVVGYLLFIVPGIILSVRYSFAIFATLYEEPTEGAGAIRASKALVAGRWWSMLWRWIASFVVFGIALWVLAYVLAIPFQGARVSAQAIEPDVMEEIMPLENLEDYANFTEEDYEQLLKEYGYDLGEVENLGISPFGAGAAASLMPSLNFQIKAQDIILQILSLLFSPLFLAVGVILYSSAKKNPLKRA